MKIDHREVASSSQLKFPKFSKAFCVKPGFRYSALQNYCDTIEYITDGFSTNVEDLAYQISESLKDYDPDRDCIVPTGTGIVNMLIGYYLASKHPDSSVAVAFFQREAMKHNHTVVPEDYTFYRFYPNIILNQWS